MKRFTYLLKAVCSIGTAILIYVTVIRATEGGDNILLYVLASVFAVVLTASLFAVSALSERCAELERTVRSLVYEGYEQEEAPQTECPFCHAKYDADEEICPYCKNEAPSVPGISDRFETEDPEYRGTDFSGEDLVSANADITDINQ